jgi:predicted DNA-binding WGR domain protein
VRAWIQGKGTFPGTPADPQSKEPKLGELFFGYSEGYGNVTAEFMDVLEQESGEVLDEAKRIFEDAKKIHHFFEKNTLPRVSKYLGLSFDETVKNRLAVRNERLSACQKFAFEAIMVFPAEIEAFAETQVKGEPTDKNGSYLIAVYAALKLCQNDQSKNEKFAEGIEKFARFIYDGYSKNIKDSRKRDILVELLFYYFMTNTAIQEIFRKIIEDGWDIIAHQDGKTWDKILPVLGYPASQYSVFVGHYRALPNEVDTGKKNEDGEASLERPDALTYFIGLLKTDRNLFDECYQIFVAKAYHFAQRLLKIMVVNGEGKDELAELNKNEAYWKATREAFVTGRLKQSLRSLASVADICPEAEAIYRSVFEAERQNKKKKQKEYFNAMVSLYFTGRAEEFYGEKPQAILEELLGKKNITIGEFFTACVEQMDTRYPIPAAATEYALASYTADAETFTADNKLSAEDAEKWINLAGDKLRPEALVPALNNPSKKVVALVEKIAIAAASANAELVPSLTAALNATLPKLKKQGAIAGERLLEYFGAAKKVELNSRQAVIDHAVSKLDAATKKATSWIDDSLICNVRWAGLADADQAVVAEAVAEAPAPVVAPEPAVPEVAPQPAQAGAKRCFVYTDDKSNKFWNIEAAGTGLMVTYGKVGAGGQTSEKSFSDEAACAKEVSKLIAEKAKKGYVEQGSAVATAPKAAPAVKVAPAVSAVKVAAKVGGAGDKVPVEVMRYFLGEYLLQEEAAQRPICVSVAKWLNLDDLRSSLDSLYDGWDKAGADTKLKGIMIPYCIYQSDSKLLALKASIDSWIGGVRGALAAFVMGCLAANGGDIAFLIVDGYAQKAPNKQVKSAAKDALSRAAAMQNITVDELSDKIVPSLGFNQNGVRTFDYGSRQLQLMLQKDFSLTITDLAAGKEVKAMPSPSAKDDVQKAEASKKEVSELKKQLKAVVRSQIFRLGQVLSNGRPWKLEAWKRLFVENPVMHQLAGSLVWGAFEAGAEAGKIGKMLETFRYMDDGSFNTADDTAYTLPENALITLAHPLEMGDKLTAQWKQQLADYEIVQPIKQLDAKISPITEKDMAPPSKKIKFAISRYKDITVADAKMVGLAKRYDMIRGEVQDSGTYFCYSIGDTWLNLGAGITFDGLTHGSGIPTKLSWLYFYKLPTSKAEGNPLWGEDLSVDRQLDPATLPIRFVNYAMSVFDALLDSKEEEDEAE